MELLWWQFNFLAMKLTNKKHPFFILLFLFPLLAVAQNDNRLVAYYTLEGNADDQSGNDNHGTTFNVDPATGYKGNSETAYQFRNANQSYISVPHSASLSLNKEMTLMAWIYYEDQASSNFFTLLERPILILKDILAMECGFTMEVH